MSTTFTEENNTEVKYGSLKTLTVLTYIGSALQLIMGFWQYATADKRVADMEKQMASPDFDKMPDFVKKMMSPEALQQAKAMAANNLPLLVLALIGGVLGILGAMQMRKLKMPGYYIWLLSELVPLIGTVIFVGTSVFSGFGAIGLAFPLLFIILYTLQRKYLINK